MKKEQKPKSQIKNSGGPNKVVLVFGIILIVALIIASLYLLYLRLGGSISKVSDEYNLFSDQAQNQSEDFEVASDDEYSIQSCLFDKGYSSVIYVYSPTCPHCQAMMPIVDELVSEGYNITKVNVYDSQNVASVGACVNLKNVVPQYVCNKDGTITQGEITKEELQNFYINCYGSQ